MRGGLGGPGGVPILSHHGGRTKKSRASNFISGTNKWSWSLG